MSVPKLHSNAVCRMLVLAVPMIVWLCCQTFLLATGDPVCNTKKMTGAERCDLDFDAGTRCQTRTDQTTCEATLGSSGFAPKWSLDCEPGDRNTDHCVIGDPKQCMEKFTCMWDGINEMCGADTATGYWWKVAEAISPTCVVE